MTFSLSGASILKMNGVHPDLQKVVKRAIELSDVDFKVVQGVRTQAYQDDLYEHGRSKPGPIVTYTRNSKHIPQKDGYGHAVDLAAFVNGSVSWNEEYYPDIAKAMKDASEELNIPIVCGIDWEKADPGHYQLAKDAV